jgi:hypothetical protein
MARKMEWYEEQAAQAPWRGTVNGRDAYSGEARAAG